MKKTKLISLLFLIGEILLLIAAIILVVKFIPDFGEKPGVGESLPAATESSLPAPEESGGGESGGGESGSAGEEESRTGESGGGTAQETYGRPGGDQAYRPKGSSHGSGTAPCPEEAQYVYTPPKLILASDLHYLSPVMTDYGEAFERRMETDDGKVLRYMEEILDAFLEEVTDQKPSALILSGDISYNGEKVNHEELAKKLKPVRESGIPVLVIPGNHDIRHPWSASYFGEEKEEAETVDADGFYEIYHEFGYDQAADRDPSSLSYLYKLDEKYWLMMLDSCIYDPVNEVGGRIRKGTLEWMEKWLDEAEREGITVIPIAHHNLLKESALYPEECTLENNKTVIALLERYHLPVYISGHLHLQRVKKNLAGPTEEENYGIHEIVSGALSIPPCQYGVMKWDKEGSFTYHTKSVDVSSWAAEHQREEEELLNFDSYADAFLIDVIAEQIFKSLESIPDDRKTEMAELYGTLNSVYCAGRVNQATQIKQTENYFFWERYMGSSKWFDRLSAILKDTKRDHNSLSLTAGKDFPKAEEPDGAAGPDENKTRSE